MDEIPVIASGGIFTGADAKEKIECWCIFGTGLDRFYL